ncbi:uncharacterized protein LOC127841922 [Dreissena polymorpha]|uniref:Uncharacterized protein n=1 Tax=Dreissena polymorpha TaxID=45954 RepID=A0A9D4IVH8_DREPO|nr:uncharacterized protein LOC127841922 [Dreissena polymorpha]KAH3789786.1 hypothetical protein DPMN_167974 [Dreissena polymorpha]
MLLYVTLLTILLGLTEATVCKVKSDCAVTECCYIRPQFLVASKRQLGLPLMPLQTHDTGVCESYKNPGDPCDPLETMNGHCGCASGYSCQWVPAPSTAAPVGRRSMIYHPGPGSYQCAAHP